MIGGGRWGFGEEAEGHTHSCTTAGLTVKPAPSQKGAELLAVGTPVSLPELLGSSAPPRRAAQAFGGGISQSATGAWESGEPLAPRSGQESVKWTWPGTDLTLPQLLRMGRPWNLHSLESLSVSSPQPCLLPVLPALPPSRAGCKTPEASPCPLLYHRRGCPARPHACPVTAHGLSCTLSLSGASQPCLQPRLLPGSRVPADSSLPSRGLFHRVLPGAATPESFSVSLLSAPPLPTPGKTGCDSGSAATPQAAPERTPHPALLLPKLSTPEQCG